MIGPIRSRTPFLPANLDGGPNDDTLYGGGGTDCLLGGPGDDFLDAGSAAETAIDGGDDLDINPYKTVVGGADPGDIKPGRATPACVSRSTSTWSSR